GVLCRGRAARAGGRLRFRVAEARPEDATIGLSREVMTPAQESWLARNRKLLAESPRLFCRKLATWLRPMRGDYRRRWDRGLRRWLTYYQTDVVFEKVSWMGLTARKNVLDAWMYQQIMHEVRPEIVIEI